MCCYGSAHDILNFTFGISVLLLVIYQIEHNSYSLRGRQGKDVAGKKCVQCTAYSVRRTVKTVHCT